MEKTKRAGTAYHEAGHAVIAYRLGYPVHSVTIDPAEDYAGLAVAGNPLYGYDPEIGGFGDPIAERMRHRLFVSYAGPVAEGHFDPDGVDLTDSSDDFDDIYALVMWFGGGDNDVGERFAEQAGALVLEHWPLIDRVARALLERTTLSGAELAELIDFDWSP